MGGNYAFKGCSSLKSINIPKNVSYIADTTFIGCTSLQNINVDPENNYYSSENGILYNKEKTEVILYYPNASTN